jgi:chemotaxis protein methyltransferase CheR
MIGIAPASYRRELPQEDVAVPPTLSEPQFDFLRALAYRHAGIALADHKQSMVQRRISRRISQLGLGGFGAYCDLLRGQSGEGELEHLVNALTTNKTDFFRENHHFEHLTKTVVPAFTSSGSKRLRIWSAGCSTGQEPYSVAMTLLLSLQGFDIRDVKVLATDIDTEVLVLAENGCFNRSEIETLPRSLGTSCFVTDPKDASRCRVTPLVRDLVSFRHLNLHASWPMTGPFDAIFCRNTVIYFDKPTQSRLFDRFANILAPGGWLYVGHSESLFSVSSRFQFEGQSIYRKIA